MDPQDINQGSLGSCYLMVALSGLVENEKRIKQLFKCNENSKGVYAIQLLIQGEIKIITIDDYIPCSPNERKPVFSTSKDKETWVMLLEKAWAKINGNSYMKIWLGTPQEALTSLSTAPCIYEYHKKYLENNCAKSNIIWEKLMEAMRRKWVVCTNTEDIEKADELGLVTFHAYALIQIYECRNNIRLLKLRNPWGNQEWKGDYSHASEKWTEDLKKEVKYKSEACKQGTFFMCLEDFLKYFPWSFFCKYEDEYRYFSKKFIIGSSNQNNKAMISPTIMSNTNQVSIDMQQYMTSFILIKEKTKVTFCLNQPQKRFLEDDNIISYKIPLASIILLKYECSKSLEEKYTHILSEFINWEKIYLEVVLQPGEYHIFSKSIWIYDKPLEIVLSSYAESLVPVYELPKEEIPSTWLEQTLFQICQKKPKKDYFHKIEKDSYCSHTIFEHGNNTGYGIFYYENNSNEGDIKVRLLFKKAEGIRILNCDKIIKNNKEEYEMTIPKNSKKGIIIEILTLPWNCQISWTHVLWFEYPVETIVRKNKKSPKTEICQLEPGLVISVIPHEIGYVIHTENKNQCKYLINFVFLDQKNFIIDNDEILDLDNGIEFYLEGKAIHYLNVKSVDKTKETIFKFNKKFKRV